MYAIKSVTLQNKSLTSAFKEVNDWQKELSIMIDPWSLVKQILASLFIMKPSGLQ